MVRTPGRGRTARAPTGRLCRLVRRRVSLPSLEQSRSLRYATVFGLYVMQGVPAGFALTAVANRLAAEGTSPPAIGRFVALVGVPWTVQLFWGPVIDRFQGSRMGRRKPWVFFAQIAALVASLGLLLVSDPARQVGLLTAVFFVHSVCASVQDASADAMAITVTRPEERARVNAFMRAGLLAGDAIGAAGLAVILRRSGFGAAAVAQTLVLLACSVAFFFVRERPGDALAPWGRGRAAPANAAPNELPNDPSDGPPAGDAPHLTFPEIFRRLAGGMRAPESVRLYGAILAVYFAGSVFVRAFNVHLVQRLHWDDTALSVLTGTWGMGAAAVAVLLAGLAAGRAGPRRLLLGVTGAIGAYLVLLCLLAPLWPHAPFTRAALVLWYTADPGFSVAAMPVLMTLCRKGVEGSQFTAYMALVNLADVAGNYVAGYALTVTSAPVIGLACGAVVWAGWEAMRRSALGRTPLGNEPSPAPVGAPGLVPAAR